MAASVLLKYGVILAVIGGLMYAVHNNGRVVERAEWRQRENVALAAKHRELERALDQLAEQTRKNAALAVINLKLNDEVTSRANRALEIAAANDSAIRRDPRGLRLPRETCPAPRPLPVPAPGNRPDDDNGNGRDGGPRLPIRIETGLYDLTYRANKTRIKRDECRAFAIGVARIREEWEAAQAGQGE